MTSDRHYHLFDRICMSVDQALRTLNNHSARTGASYPAENTSEAELTTSQRKHAAGLMRVNHTGEVCAQALYHGQALVSRSSAIAEKMQEAALEEGDHLFWCKQRLDELQSHPSYLNPLWYSGSFCIGLVAGMIGDAWSLGFVAETERQVIKHLEKHLQLLPPEDQRSHAILTQMENDEAKHRDEALAAGARDLPWIIQQVMRFSSKIMVKTTYWV